MKPHSNPTHQTHLLRVSPLLLAVALVTALATACATPEAADDDGRSWIAGDHHVHSRFSTGWDFEAEPPTPILGATPSTPRH